MASLTLAERYRLQDLLSTSEMAEVRTATDLVLERLARKGGAAVDRLRNPTRHGTPRANGSHPRTNLGPRPDAGRLLCS
jgi:hypothetical protein